MFRPGVRLYVLTLSSLLCFDQTDLIFRLCDRLYVSTLCSTLCFDFVFDFIIRLTRIIFPF